MKKVICDYDNLCYFVSAKSDLLCENATAEFFSILPPENINGKFTFADKLDFDEEDEHLVHKSSARNGMAERVREEELLIKRNPLHLQGTSSFEENRLPQTDKNKLERVDKMNSVKDKELQ